MLLVVENPGHDVRATKTLGVLEALSRNRLAAFEVDEAKDIRDKAVAMEAYFKQVQNAEAECRAC